MEQKYILKFASAFQDTPCIIGVVSYNITKPWYGNPQDCPSDLDYYGGVDIEWELLKFNGKPFDWLENKLTRKDRIGIEEEIVAQCGYLNELDYCEDNYE
ncbi:hypothetical protein M0R04_04965 [Candidatus Dojkabacteria bacterium]|jgi:hypothetical protein|nr:hypothetical protein [Candidatus Dojkabacteria bacterium]